MSIKQLPQTAATLPVDNLPTELQGASAGFDQEAWTAIRTLIERVNQSGLTATPPARIYITGNQVISAAVNTWTPLPLTSTVAGIDPVNLSLAANQVTYNNSRPNNLFLSGVAYFSVITVSNVRVGYRLNGDDGTIVSQTVSAGRTEFVAPVIGAANVANGDYIEMVASFSVVQTNIQILTTLYTQHTGFSGA